MDIVITKIRPSHSGEEVELHIILREGVVRDEEVFLIAPQFYEQFHLPLWTEDQISIDKNTYERLEYGHGLTDAIRKGLNLVAFSENSGKTLYGKLLKRGVPAQHAAEAVAYLKDHGFINEDRQAQMLAEDLATKRLYGPRRIRQELYAKGYSNDLISVINSSSGTVVEAIATMSIRL